MPSICLRVMRGVKERTVRLQERRTYAPRQVPHERKVYASGYELRMNRYVKSTLTSFVRSSESFSSGSLRCFGPEEGSTTRISVPCPGALLIWIEP